MTDADMDTEILIEEAHILSLGAEEEICIEPAAKEFHAIH
ncbi:unnamed protein product [Acanthoscelides obtectus]|uniref:Uncharacterized protein n=1 Tax=Acanthoscelides obtectus TaxID=200917 RepID=A0A9P0Q4I6_ACAOB|nr:unnamed protein product [Acanthoscelides obtectus]CAK1672189.1 hypothetical protein AOBTE_LOCUS28706 [Acanthoscelides obtectus]